MPQYAKYCCFTIVVLCLVPQYTNKFYSLYSISFLFHELQSTHVKMTGSVHVILLCFVIVTVSNKRDHYA